MLVSCLHGLTQPVKDLEEPKTELDEIYERIENKDEMPKVIDLNKSPIYKFYENKTVLVTGATGYLGRTLVEKLLRACPVKKVFVVLRPKKNQSMEERGKKMFDNLLFDKMKERNPKWREQVEFIGGEAVRECFSFTKETQAKVRSEVNLIFHQAAIVKFNEELDFSLRVNVVGTIEMIKFAKTCPNLEAFVHVSTAYSHAYMFNTEETYYPTPISIDEMFEYLNMKDNELREARKQEILSQWKIDCIYPLTKALAENYIRDNCKNLPIGIFKPSIVSASYHEPYKFWTDTLSGLNPWLIGLSMGAVHVAYAKKDLFIDHVPVDMCTNATIATAWDIAQAYKTMEVIELPPMYNYAAGEDNPTNYEDALKMSEPYYPSYPATRQLYYYFQIRTETRAQFYTYDFILHFIPAIFADVYLMAIGKKPRLLKFYLKIRKYFGLTLFFVDNRWHFDTKRSRSLWDKMTPEDQELFFCDIRKLDWPHYLQKYWNGLRVYLLKDPMENVEEAKKKYRRLQLLHYLITTMITVMLAFLMFKIFSFILGVIF